MNMSAADRETLAQYVTRIIKEKDLKHHEVKELSGGRITDGYVRGIMSGKASNPSVDKLKALAQGLGVLEDEIFRVARGLPPQGDGKKTKEQETNYQAILSLMLGSLKNRTLADLLVEASRLPLESQQEAVELLRYLNTRKRVASRSSRNA
jgi:transcriptional regulator with XRE-family HTH domain